MRDASKAMKTVADLLRREPVWVNPAHRIETALLLMQGHDLSGLPVLEGPMLVGVLLAQDLIGVEKGRRVEEVMERRTEWAPPTLSVREAADLMVRSNLPVLPVMSEDGEMLGLITAQDLLPALRRAVDPTTDLPWSDSMREWAIERLETGREITLLFVDVNDFGHFNKRYGHVIGDTVLRSVADVLREQIDPDRDTLCRYGGDEFCIASIRGAAEAAGLAEQIEREVTHIQVPEADYREISVCIGLHGGRRTREREPIHYTATLNNLINLASQDCTRSKELRRRHLEQTGENDGKQLNAGNYAAVQSAATPAAVREEAAPLPDSQNPGGVEPAAPPAEALRLTAIEVNWIGDVAHVHVTLEEGNPSKDCPAGEGALISYEGSLSQPIDRESLPLLVARTTAIALRRTLPTGYHIVPDEVMQAQTGEGRTLVTIIGRLDTPEGSHPVIGSAFVGSDRLYAVANAVLAANPLQS